MRAVSVVGGPANLPQLAPVARALSASGDVEHLIIYAGRRDGPELVAAIAELGLPPARYHLEVGGGSDGMQIGLMLQRLEPALAELRPDVVLAYGDDTAAAAAALAAGALRIRFGHVEAGLRSGDGAGGETIPRLVSDVLADVLFVPSRDAIGALKAEGVAEERIQFVGSVRIDGLCWALAQGAAQAGDSAPYAVTSLHEPGAEIVQALGELRSRFRIAPAPAAYVERMTLVASAALVVTDSDDLQDETSFLGIPCITLQAHTDHPTTCQHGTNRLVAPQRETFLAAANRALSRRAPARPLLERWDGRAAERIARVLCDGAEFTSERESEVASAARRRRAVALPQMA
jgi:UDP-N-acetylglucosamine 2-epimerase (non-hydrolysing)